MVELGIAFNLICFSVLKLLRLLVYCQVFKIHVFPIWTYSFYLHLPCGLLYIFYVYIVSFKSQTHLFICSRPAQSGDLLEAFCFLLLFFLTKQCKYLMSYLSFEYKSQKIQLTGNRSHNTGRTKRY